VLLLFLLSGLFADFLYARGVLQADLFNLIGFIFFQLMQGFQDGFFVIILLLTHLDAPILRSLHALFMIFLRVFFPKVQFFHFLLRLQYLKRALFGIQDSLPGLLFLFFQQIQSV